MKLLALSGSARRLSTNTALLRTMSAVAPDGVEITVYDRLAFLPVFSPDLEEPPLPAEVARLKGEILRHDGLIISSPEYVRAIPGGLKNAIDWLVSGDELITKPVALMHASHRGDDMLEQLRIVLATVSQRFAPDIFLRLPLMKMAPAEIQAHVAREPNATAVRAFLTDFARFCASVAQP